MEVKLVSKTVGVGEYEKLTTEALIATVARHGAIKKDNGSLVKYLMSNKHWSPLEFLNYTFKITTSRDIARQLLRHKSATGFQEWSLRYAEPIGFEDIEIRKEHKTNRQSSSDVFNPIISPQLDAKDCINTTLSTIRVAYTQLINAGVAKECARSILPGCTTTVLHINASLRTWLSILNVRLDEHSQKEIRDVCMLIGASLEKELPDVFSHIDWKNGMFL